MGFWATESFVSNSDYLSIGQFIGFFQASGSSGSSHFLFKIQCNIAELFFNITYNLTFSSGGERVASLSKDLHKVVSQVTASQVQPEDGMGQSITFIDGDGMGYTISRVQDNTSGPTRGIKRQHSLDGHIHGRRVEGFEHDLSHLFPVSFGVQGGLGQEDGMFFGCNTEFIVESVMPDLLHIVPVGDDTMFNGVFEGQDTSLGLSLISNIGIFLAHTNHDTLVAGSTNNGGED